MALTRNLYREDEVLAALRHSIVVGNVDAALFWTQEGIESDMDVRIFQTLLSVWLHCVGLQNIYWLGWLIAALRSDLEEETIVSLVTELTRSSKDCGVFALQVLGLDQTAAAPDHVGTFALPPGLQGLPLLETTFAKAVLQGKAEFAWALAVPLWANSRADSVLWEIQPLAVFSGIQDALDPIWSDEFIWPFRALAILMAVSNRDRDFGYHEMAPLPGPSAEHLTAWTARKTMRMRERRQFSVPPECLFWFTNRGTMRNSETTETDLMLSLRPALAQSPFWEDKLDFDEFMTSDIPDEWSAAARRVSHGPGASDSVIAAHFETMLCAHASKLIWKGGERATKLLMGRWALPGRTSFEAIIQAEYAGRTSFEAMIEAEYAALTPLVEKWDLTPRRVVIAP